MVACEHWLRDLGRSYSFVLECLVWYFDLMLLTGDAHSTWSNVLNSQEHIMHSEQVKILQRKIKQ